MDKNGIVIFNIDNKKVKINLNDFPVLKSFYSEGRIEPCPLFSPEEARPFAPPEIKGIFRKELLKIVE
jgi:hypothetical protein